MSTDSMSHLEEALVRMVDERFPEGLVRTLEGQFPEAAHADYEDAVSAGFEQLVRKAERRLENPRGYVTTVAVHAMKRLLRRATVQRLAEVYPDDEDEDDGVDDPLDAYTDPWSDEVVDQTMLDDAYEFMRKLVDA